jgi:PRC-barrel domain protein
MSRLKPIRMMGAAVVLAAMPLAASAQTQGPSPTVPPPTAPPPATRPDPAPTPPSAMPPRTPDKSATAPAKVNPMIGLAVFSSDGSKMGTVQAVSTAPDGQVKAIQFKTGGFLGFGGKNVSVPEGRFTKSGDAVQLGMTSEEVGKLPEVKEQS